MGLSKNITLTIKDYEIKLDKEIKFYENDTIDLCFSILEYGIEVKDGISINKLMPIQALRSYMLIETPHGIDYAESTKIEDNKIVFNLGTKYSQFVGIGRMQIVVKDSDGCRVTLPEFEFEIKESINMNWDRESFDFLATEDDSIIIDEFGRKIHMSKISDMPESENMSEESYAMIIDEEGNKRFKVRAIVDAVEDSLDAKFNAYTDEINGDVEEFKGSVRTNITTLTNENNTFKNQVNTSLADYGSDYNSFKDNVEARLGEHMTDYNRFKDGVETRIEEGESTYDGFVSDVSTVLDNYGSTYNAFKSEVNTANESFRNTLNASNRAFRNEMVDRYDNFIYKIDEDIFEGGRTDYFGETHEKIGERLDLDFDVVHQRINDSGLMEYEGCSITANNTYYGRQKDTVVKGRTLHNILIDGEFRSAGSSTGGTVIVNTKDEIKKTIGSDGSCVFTKDLKVDIVKDRTYTAIFEYFCTDTTLSNVTVSYYGTTVEEGETYRIGAREVFFTDGTKYTRYMTTLTITSENTPKSLCIGYHGGMKEGTELGVKNVILLEGDYTQTPLEELPFIKGIESVGDKSKNLFDGVLIEKTDSTDFEKIKTGFRFKRISGDGIQACVGFRIPRGSFNISYNVKGGTKSSNLVVKMANKAEAGTNGLVINSQIEIGQEKTFSANFINTENDLIVFYTDQTDSIFEITNIQIEEGTQVTPYQEYYDGYKISGKSHGKNLFKITDNYIKSDGSFTIEFDKDNQSITVNGINEQNDVYIYMNRDYPWEVTNNNIGYHTLQMHELCGSYKFVSNTSGNYFAMGVRDKDDSTKTYISLSSSQEFNIGDVLSNVGGTSWFRFNRGIQFDNFTFTIQFEESTEPTPYEPYKESNYSYILNEPLRSLPNGVCDEIDLTTGVLTRRVGVLRITGEENWGTLITTHDMYNESSCVISNKKVFIEESNSISSFTSQSIYNRVASPYNTTGVWIRVPKTIDTLEKFKAHVKNGKVYGILPEPIIEQLTPQQLKSYDTTTHVISDNKLMPIVSTKIPTDLGAMVNTLSLRNRELEEVNEQQDELIDITMMATDEMYSMLEPLMEAVEPMGLLDCSKMAQMYVAMVRRGIKKIEDIPSRYQEEVKEALGIKIEEEEWGEDDGIK